MAQLRNCNTQYKKIVPKIVIVTIYSICWHHSHCRENSDEGQTGCSPDLKVSRRFKFHDLKDSEFLSNDHSKNNLTMVLDHYEHRYKVHNMGLQLCPLYQFKINEKKLRWTNEHSGVTGV